MACVRESDSESSVGAIESAESDEREMRVSDGVCVSRSACDGARERRDGAFCGRQRPEAYTTPTGLRAAASTARVLGRFVRRVRCDL